MSRLLQDLLKRTDFQGPGDGPLYLRLRRLLEELIASGQLKQGEALPAERDLAEYADISRVTVRKAVDDLVKSGLLSRRRGSGTFVAMPVSRVEQTLTRLTSFTEDMERRGIATRAEWLRKGLFIPSPEEMMMLGLGNGYRVARLERLRFGDDLPLAIERASISEEFLPEPELLAGSLYRELDKMSARPIRAMQRISATNLREADAALLGVAVGSAGLAIERVGYLQSGRVVELTRSLYRGDAYDFVAELSLSTD
jgi:GntR family transcriptional regulator